MGKGSVEIIKAEVPRWLAERFRRYVAEKYGLRKGAISKAITDMIERELGVTEGPGTVEGIVGLGLSSDYRWDGEDLLEALSKRYDDVPDRRQRGT
ncbi:MAG: hypothetical protein RMJ59_01570 [Candidatus Nitrosocaldus sp.]|nr:hypothetical protein [Candidatus Nitrosocaldus sp.]MDW8275054.1 hypothetical protein [Candidatus Nitrosocaldus sp.]